MNFLSLLELMDSEQGLLPSDVQPAVKENKPADDSESTRAAVNSLLFQQGAAEQADHEMSGEEVRVGSEGVKEDPMIVDTFDATSATALIESREEEAKLGQELIVSEQTPEIIKLTNFISVPATVTTHHAMTSAVETIAPVAMPEPAPTENTAAPVDKNAAPTDKTASPDATATALVEQVFNALDQPMASSESTAEGRLEQLWQTAYKEVWHLMKGTCADIFMFLSHAGGMQYPRPMAILWEATSRHIERAVRHDDVARQIIRKELESALDLWTCTSWQDLVDEAALRSWQEARENMFLRLHHFMQWCKHTFAILCDIFFYPHYPGECGGPGALASGVQSAQSNLGSSYFHFRRAAFSSMLKGKCGLILVKAAALRINLNLDGALSPLSHILTHRTRKLIDC
jgi:hypothetical protein